MESCRIARKARLQSNRQQADRHVFPHFDEDAAESDHEKRTVLRIGSGAEKHFGSLDHLLSQQTEG